MKSKPHRSKGKRKSFVVCVRNDGYEASLDLGKVYIVLADLKARKYGRIRVIDNEDQDYLYPADYFLPVELSRPAIQALSAA